LTGAEGRPSLLGVSGGNYNSLDGTSCCAGTLGALVKDSKGNNYVLSTNSVLARVSPSTGHFKAQVGEKIVQPGLVDTGCFQDSGDGIGTLKRWVPLNFGLNNNNSVDAAIALVQPGMLPSDGYIFNIGPISSSTIPVDELSIGDYVQKMGRTSCLTAGQVDALDATGKVAYLNNSCRSIGVGNANFSHQILIIPSTSSGASGIFATTSDGASDSGALVLTQESCPRAIGMIFATTSNNVTVINPIAKVLKALKVALVGGCTNSGSFAVRSGDQADSDATEEQHTTFRASFEVVRAVKDRHQQELLDLDDVAGTAIGRGDNPGQAAMLVLVKKDTAEIRAKIPAQIEGVPVKIIESGEFRAL
jgi:hypothetical protein